MINKITLTTTIYPDGKIRQLEMHHDDMNYAVGRKMEEWLDTKEKAVHEALVKLGWTPPGECNCQKAQEDSE